MDPRPGAWRLNDPYNPEDGGIPGVMFWDTVIPYTSPVQRDLDPEEDWPEWWPPETSPPDPLYVGNYQSLEVLPGWQRNLVGPLDWEAENWSPNFPESSGFRIALVSSEGLFQTAGAPPRIEPNFPGNPKDDDLPGLGSWWHQMEGGLQLFWELYLDRYISSPTGEAKYYVIVGIPEREIRRAFQSTDPDNSVGKANIVDFVEFVLRGWGQFVIGFLLGDEPDSERGLDLADYMTLDRLRKVADWVREGERNASEVNLKAIRPTLITLTPDYFFDDRILDTGKQAAYEAWRDVADIVIFDEYPFRCTMREVIRDGVDNGIDESEMEEMVTAQAERLGLYILHEYQEAYNLNGMLSRYNSWRNWLAQPQLLMIQAYGGVRLRWRDGRQVPTFRPASEDDDPTWFWPAETPRPLFEDQAETRLNYDRVIAVPQVFKLRFLTWASVLMGSNGMACFSLMGLPSALLLESETEPGSDGRYGKVAREVQYFQRLRWQALEQPDRSGEIGVEWAPPTPVPPGSPYPGPLFITLSPNRHRRVLFFNFTPEGATEPETYLAICNMFPIYQEVTLSPAINGRGGRDFYAWAFGARLNSPLDQPPFISATAVTKLRIPEHTFWLFKLTLPS